MDWTQSQSKALEGKNQTRSDFKTLILTNKSDFFAWDEGVTNLLRVIGLFGHILDPLAPPDPTRPDCIPTPLPILSTNHTMAETSALACWWNDDNKVQHVLVTRVGTVPCGLLPSSNVADMTALSIYQILVKFYGTSNYLDCTEVLNTLHNTPCQPGRMLEYVSKWRIGLSCLQLANFYIDIILCLNQFVCGLPNIAAFNTLQAELPNHVIAAGDHDFGAFISLSAWKSG